MPGHHYRGWPSPPPRRQPNVLLLAVLLGVLIGFILAIPDFIAAGVRVWQELLGA